MATLRYKDPVTGQYKDDIHVVGAVSSVNGQTGVVDSVVDRFSCQKIKPFLYEATAMQIDYDYAYDFFLTRNPNVPANGCSAVRIGNEYGRNFDWQYNNQASFALHVPACDGRYASVGIAGSVPGVLDTNESAWDKKIIPFFTQDGINEYGLTVSTLVVPSEGQENRSVPTGTKRDSVNGIMLCRYMLDRYKTVDEAIADLTAHVEIWFSDSLHDMNYEQHWLIADAEDTYAIEVVNNAIVVREIDALTNFLVNGVTFNGDGTVYTPATLAQGSPTADNGITAHGSGLERWNIIAQHTTGTMRDLLNSLKYTNAYQQDTGWHTEFVGGSLHCDSQVSAFAAAEAEARTAYQSRTRDNPVTWQTVHSAIYNIAERSLTVVVQEDGVEIAVGLDAVSERVADLEDTVATQSTAIAQKAPLEHTQPWSSITNTPDAYPPEAHVHDISDVTWLENRLENLEDRYKTITVTCVTLDGVTVTGQTVYLRNGDSADAPLVQTAEYDGQPVTFEVPINYAYHISVSDSLEGHFNPNTATGVTDTDKSVTLTYSDVGSIRTYADLQSVLPLCEHNVSMQNALIGVEIADTWTAENGTTYDDPMIVMSLEYIKDADDVQHWGAYVERKWASKDDIQFDAPEAEEVKAATEPTALEGLYYYGQTGNTLAQTALTLLDLAEGDAIPYGDYDKIYHNAIQDATCYIVSNGYNNWRQSAYRQYLNSNAAVNVWWTATHVGDVAPTKLSSVRGYMAGCSAALLAAAKPCKVSCNSNTKTDGGAVETVIDTFWLPSATQMYGNGNTDEGVYWPYWKRATGLSSPDNAANDGRKIYAIESNTSAQTCRLRSAHRSNSYSAWYVHTSGYLYNTNAYGSYRAAPACAIW